MSHIWLRRTTRYKTPGCWFIFSQMCQKGLFTKFYLCEKFPIRSTCKNKHFLCDLTKNLITNIWILSKNRIWKVLQYHEWKQFWMLWICFCIYSMISKDINSISRMFDHLLAWNTKQCCYIKKILRVYWQIFSIDLMCRFLAKIVDLDFFYMSIIIVYNNEAFNVSVLWPREHKILYKDIHFNLQYCFNIIWLGRFIKCELSLRILEGSILHIIVYILLFDCYSVIGLF